MVSRVGPTDDFVVRNLVEALELFLASGYRRGQRDRVLKDCGFELDQNPESPAPDTRRMVRIPLASDQPRSTVTIASTIAGNTSHPSARYSISADEQYAAEPSSRQLVRVKCKLA